MNFAGYVQKRRAVLEHLISHKLSLYEYAAFDILLLKADSNTGSGLINAPILMYLSGNAFSLDIAERLLKGLHDAGYIWYRGRRGSKQPQPYWINRYVLTRGPYKSRRINLSELLDKSTISQQEVFDRADDTSDETSDDRLDETLDDTSDKNEKREVKREKRDKKPSSPIGNDAKNDAWNDAKNDAKKDAQRDAKRSTKGQAMTHDDAHDANAASDANDASRDARNDACIPARRVRIVPGPDAHYVDVDSGQRLPGTLVRELLDCGAATEVNQ